MNQDVLNTIILNLDMDSVIDLCKITPQYIKICQDPLFWQDYFNHHHKILPLNYNANALIDYKLIFMYNDFIPYLTLSPPQTWINLLFKIHNIYYPYAMDLINESLTDLAYNIKITPKNNNTHFNQLLSQMTNKKYNDIVNLEFDFHTRYLNFDYSEDDMWLNDYIKLTKDQLIMLLVVVLMEKKYTSLTLNTV